jgi:mRNA interferase RelE/StbE
MITEFAGRFSKDLDKINQAFVKKDVSAAILEIEKAEGLPEIRNLKKLKGHGNAYRIRIGDYRIGLFIENNIVEFARIAHRKDIYRIFP